MSLRQRPGTLLLPLPLPFSVLRVVWGVGRFSAGVRVCARRHPRFAGICLPNCVEWVVADVACALLGYPSVALYPGAVEGAVRKCQSMCALVCLASDVRRGVIRGGGGVRLVLVGAARDEGHGAPLRNPRDGAQWHMDRTDAAAAASWQPHFRGSGAVGRGAEGMGAVGGGAEGGIAPGGGAEGARAAGGGPPEGGPGPGAGARLPGGPDHDAAPQSPAARSGPDLWQGAVHMDAVEHGGAEGGSCVAAATDPPGALFTLFNTSGTTGEAKLVRRTRAAWARLLADVRGAMGGREHFSVRLQYASLAHSGARVTLWSTVVQGGQLALYRPEGPAEGPAGGAAPATILEAAARLKPTAFHAPPSVWGDLRAQYAAEWGGRGAAPPAAAEPEFRDEFAARFRGLTVRTQGLGIGAAASGAGLRQWLSELLGAPVHDGYGTTEVGGIAGDGHPDTGVHIKLMDVPELGYTGADRPMPRGEICVKTSEVCPSVVTASGPVKVPLHRAPG